MAIWQDGSIYERTGITSTADIRGTTLNAYVLHMEKNGMSAATISRYIASMKAFFEYLVRERILDEDPSFFLKPPKVEKKLPGNFDSGRDGASFGTAVRK